MIFDSHSHTVFSADSEMKAADALAAAEKAGLGLVFTEHLDLDYPGTTDFTFDPVEYWRQYELLRGRQLRLGVEVGMQGSTADRSRAFVEKVPFDLVIGSIHMVDGQDIYYKEAYGTESKEVFFAKYYQQMEQNIRQHDFIDVLGHIDYIARYAPYDNPEVGVAVRIGNGYSSGNAASVAKDILNYKYNFADESDIVTGAATASKRAGPGQWR